MFCIYCGNQLPDDALFCDKCGEKTPEGVAASANRSMTESASSALSQPAANEPEVLPATSPAPVSQTPPPPPQTPPATTMASAPVPPPTGMPVAPPASAPAPAPVASYPQGCLTSAWRDIKFSEGWFGRTVLLGLINCVPVLNFFVSGYCMRWAAQLPLDRVEPMPRKIFEDRNFVNGFYAVVISLVVGIISGVCSGILGIVPLLGTLVAVAVSLFLSLFEYVSVVRIAIADSLGAGFDVPQIWALMKKDFGALFCILIVPTLILLAVAFVIAIPLTFIFMGSIMGGAMAYDYGYQMSDMELILGLFMVMLPMFLIGQFLAAFFYLITYRAVGHYIARYQ